LQAIVVISPQKTLDLPNQYDATDMLINMNGDQMVDESYTMNV